MPIRIYLISDISHEIDFICEEDWELPTQLAELVKWAKNFKNGEERKVADIGFSVRRNATGGGGTLTIEEMKEHIEANIDVYFSEFGYDFEEEKDEC